QWHRTLGRGRAAPPAAAGPLALVRHSPITTFTTKAVAEPKPTAAVPTTPYGSLTVGVPRETYPDERRVAPTPRKRDLPPQKGFSRILVQRGAGVEAGFTDAAYQQAGATLVDAPAVWGQANVVLKVRGPSRAEIDGMRHGQTLISFLQPAQNKALVDKLAEQK